MSVIPEKIEIVVRVLNFIIPPVFVLFLGLQLQAQEVHTFFSGARSLAMGGAQIAVVDDETALLANPAALGKLRDYYGTIFDPEIDLTQNYNGIYQNGPFSNQTDPSQLSASVNKSRNTYYHFREQLFPSFVLRNFGIGLFYRQELDMLMNNAGTSINTFYRSDMAFLLGYNFRFFDGRIKLGFTGKVIDRVEVNNPAIAYPGNFTLQNLASEGAGVGGDVGLILTAPWTWLPTLSVVARDVGGTQFTSGKNIQMSSSTVPTAVTQDYDAAIAIFPIHANRTRSSFTLEAQKILTSQTATDPTRYYHAGWELNYSDSFFLRAGMNGHWWTGGIEISGQNLQFQLTSYGQDIGQGTTLTEDRRYVVKISLRF